MDDKAMFDVLKPFMPMWCQKVLPAVFDQSLSYYELLCKVLQKYNELVVIVNAHSEKLEDHETRIVTLETITKEIQQKLAELDTQVKQNTANIAALTERVNQHDEEIETIQAFIDGLANSTSEHGFEINQTANTISFDINGTVIPYLSAVDTLIKRGAQVMKGNFAGGSVMLGGFDTSVTAGRIYGFCVGVENGDLHYITFVSNTNANDANTGTISSWKSVEVLDISDITQSEGTEEYKTISQKVITDLLKKKLAADMGISNATVGGYLNIASVDANGRPLTYGWGTPGGSGGDVNVVQTTGQSTTDVMSQKATTDALNSSAVSVTVVYPSTSGGTDGKFVKNDGSTISRADLLANFIGSDGKNNIFTVKKTGSTSWERITWFKASVGEGIFDFEWWEYNGTTGKTGIDRITMTTAGLFAVSERSSITLGDMRNDLPGLSDLYTTTLTSGYLAKRFAEDESGIVVAHAVDVSTTTSLQLETFTLDSTLFAGVTTMSGIFNILANIGKPLLQVDDQYGNFILHKIPLLVSIPGNYSGRQRFNISAIFPEIYETAAQSIIHTYNVQINNVTSNLSYNIITKDI